MNCEKATKKTCANCEHFDYCDIAKRCNGECYNCDITDCENNPNYKQDNLDLASYMHQFGRDELAAEIREKTKHIAPHINQLAEYLQKEDYKDKDIVACLVEEALWLVRILVKKGVMEQ